MACRRAARVQPDDAASACASVQLDRPLERRFALRHERAHAWLRVIRLYASCAATSPCTARCLEPLEARLRRRLQRLDLRPPPRSYAASRLHVARGAARRAADHSSIGARSRADREVRVWPRRARHHIPRVPRAERPSGASAIDFFTSRCRPGAAANSVEHLDRVILVGRAPRTARATSPPCTDNDVRIVAYGYACTRSGRRVCSNRT